MDGSAAVSSGSARLALIVTDKLSICELTPLPLISSYETPAANAEKPCLSTAPLTLSGLKEECFISLVSLIPANLRESGRLVNLKSSISINF